MTILDRLLNKLAARPQLKPPSKELLAVIEATDEEIAQLKTRVFALERKGDAA